ncbi:MAG: DUF2924 domain-containing protein [Elusimicrobia bacterium]|nr:DUF2924 domain-containing protein [Elusimicrobiota bacterium]
MRNKVYLPKSYEELSKIEYARLQEYWEMFFLSPCRAKASILRPLWYKIQCELFGIKLVDKYALRLNKYAKRGPKEALQKAVKNKYELKVGTELIRIYNGLENKVIVLGSDKFEYKGQTYPTLSAVAKTICGSKVSGPDFFNLR